MAQATETPPILVTGGLGAIGSLVTRRLVGAGQPVVVYSRRAAAELPADLRSSVTYAQGDILERDRLGVVARAHGVRRVIHLAAALSSVTEHDPARGYQVNVVGSINVFEVARELGIERVVFASSKAAYGALPPEYGPPRFRPITEDLAGETMSVYGATKRALEEAAAHCRRLWGLDLVALRMGSTYGPGRPGAVSAERSTGLKDYIIQAAQRGEPFTVQQPDLTDDLVYNPDVAKAFVLACFAPPTEHWQFNVSSGTLVSLREFTEEVMRRCPNHRLSLAEPAGQPPRKLTNVSGLLSNERIRQELDFRPDFPGVSGVADYVRILSASVAG